MHAVSHATRWHRADGALSVTCSVAECAPSRRSTTGGPTDGGVDAIGLAPVSDVLADRVAVQIKRYNPEGSRSNIERKDVALFQRDAASKGAERAVFVTLGSFSQAAKKAATETTPHVNLIDGEKIWELVERKGLGLRHTTILDNAWFDRFD